MVLPAAAAMPVPAGWTDEQALGLVVNWPTALAALRPLGRIAAGETVLIHAAAGATGQAAVKMAKHYGATVIATASPGKHETVRALGADHVLDSRDGDLAAEVLRLTGGVGADLVLESGGGATFNASLAAAKRVTGRVVVYGVAGGEAAITNWELVYKHQVHVIGLNIGVLIQAAPQIFGELMGELRRSSPPASSPPAGPPRTTWPTAQGPRRLEGSATRATIGTSWRLGLPVDRGSTRAGPVRSRDRTVPPGAVGALLPHGRLGHDAEDLVQETYLRAWRSYAGFEGRASIRTWLYRIATNVCLTALEPRRIRVLPSGLTGPCDDPIGRRVPCAGRGLVAGAVAGRWIAPPPTIRPRWWSRGESLRLALIASLQHLPARQRAILILREVLAFSAAETADDPRAPPPRR